MATSVKPATTASGVNFFSGSSGSKTFEGGGPNLTVSDNSDFRGIYGGAGTNTFSFRAGGFEFAIPASATIDGFEFLLERKRGGGGAGSCTTNIVQIHDGTTTVGTNKETGSAMPTVDTNKIYGGPTDKWGLTYTPTDVNAETFRVQISNTVVVSSGTVSIEFDYAQMTVYYTDVEGVKRRSVSGGITYFAGCAHC